MNTALRFPIVTIVTSVAVAAVLAMQGICPAGNTRARTCAAEERWLTAVVDRFTDSHHRVPATNGEFNAYLAKWWLAPEPSLPYAFVYHRLRGPLRYELDMTCNNGLKRHATFTPSPGYVYPSPHPPTPKA